MKRYIIEMNRGTASEIAQSPRAPTPDSYSALDEIRPPVPEDGIRPGADLVSHLADDDLLRLAVPCARSTVGRFACGPLRRRIGISTPAKRLASPCKKEPDADSMVAGAIMEMAHVCETEE
jgi:hypothetical protein